MQTFRTPERSAIGAFVIRQCRATAYLLLGRNGCRRVSRVGKDLLTWLLCILLSELGICATDRIFTWFGSRQSLFALSGAAIHTSIAIAGMLGFLVSVLFGELEHLAQRLRKLRQAWKNDA